MCEQLFNLGRGHGHGDDNIGGDPGDARGDKNDDNNKILM